MKNDELQQKLFEFAYGLLSEDESREIDELITSDPQVARAYAEVMLHCDVLAEALRAPAEQVVFNKPTTEFVRAKPATKQPQEVAPSSSRWGNWAAVTAASILACILSISLGGYGWLSYRASQVAQGPLVRMDVLAPRELNARSVSALTVVTSDWDHNPISTDVEVSLRNVEDQSVVYRRQVATDEKGQAFVELPATAPTDGVELLVRAAKASEREAVRGQLRFRQQESIAHLQTDRATYHPNDEVQARAVVLNRLTAQPAPPARVNFTLAEDATEATPNVQQTTKGVASATLPLDESQPRTTEVVARSPEGHFADATKRIYIEQDPTSYSYFDMEFAQPSYVVGDQVSLYAKLLSPQGEPLPNVQVDAYAVIAGEERKEAAVSVTSNAEGQVKLDLPVPAAEAMEVVLDAQPAEGLAKQAVARVPVGATQAQVQFFPEGGHLTVGMPNRVYFQVLSPDQQPLEATGRVVDSNDQTVAQLATRRELQAGRGYFELIPARGVTYHVQLDEPSGYTAGGELIPSTEEFFAALQVEESVLDPSDTLRVRVTSSAEPRTMVLVATCRGVEVGHTFFEIFPNGQPVSTTIPLSEEAAGAIRVTLFDYGDASNRVVAERLVYRHPSRRLQLELNEVAASNSQSDTATGEIGRQYHIQVKDAQGQPTTATLGALAIAGNLSDFGSSQAGLPADYYLLSEAQPAEWENVSKYLENTPLAQQQLEFFLGVQPWRDRSEPSYVAADFAYTNGASRWMAINDSIEPPYLLQNDDSLTARAARIADWRADAQHWMGTTGRIALLWGVVTLFVALLVAGMQKVATRVWVTTVGVSIASLALVWVMIGGEIVQHARLEIAQGAAHSETPDAENAEAANADFRTDVTVNDRFAFKSPAVAPMAPAQYAESQEPLPPENAAPAQTPENYPPLAQPADEPRSTEMNFVERVPETDAALGAAADGTGRARGGLELDRPKVVTESADANMRARSFGGGYGGAPPPPAPAPSKAEAETLDDTASALQEIPQDHLTLDKAADENTWRDQLHSKQHSPVLLWEPLVTVDPDGQATIQFTTPMDLQNWFLIVTAHGPAGIGELRHQINSTAETTLAGIVPRRASLGDRFDDGQLNTWNFHRGMELGFGQTAETLSLQSATTENRRQSTLMSGMRHVDSRNSFSENWSDFFRQLSSNVPAVVVTRGEYPLGKGLAGNLELEGKTTLRGDLPGYVAGTPVQVTLRIYPSLAAEILDAARATFASQPMLRSVTFAALQDVQAWMNTHGVADVDLMRAINHQLKQRDPANWNRELLQQDPSLTGTYQQVLSAYLATTRADSNALKLLTGLAELQTEEGRVPCDSTPTGAGARSQEIEATALSVLAWSRHEQFADNARRALHWLRSQRDGHGGWATEEAHALALMALCTDNARPLVASSDAELSLSLADQVVALTVQSGAVRPILWAGELVADANNAVELNLTAPADHSWPYVAQMKYEATKPEPANESPNLRIATSLSATSAKVGDRVQLSLTVEGVAEPLIAVRIPIPAGMQVENYPLPEHRWQEGDLVLYLQSPFVAPAEWVQSEQKLETSIPLIATDAGTFMAPAARVYPAHAPEQTVWADPLHIEVQP